MGPNRAECGVRTAVVHYLDLPVVVVEAIFGQRLVLRPYWSLAAGLSHVPVVVTIPAELGHLAPRLVFARASGQASVPAFELLLELRSNPNEPPDRQGHEEGECSYEVD